MKVILLQDLKILGKKGDIKEVSEGYARNYLFPKKIAGVATSQAISSAEQRRKEEERKQTDSFEKVGQLAETIKGRKIIIKSKEKSGKLFGSIGSREIAGALGKENISLEEKGVMLENPIKKIGEYKIKLRLAPKVETEILLLVEGEK